MAKVAILDYGSGNIASLFSAFNSLNANPYLAGTIFDLKKADAIILPGVGHFGYACENLIKNKLREGLIEIIKSGIPTLGICLGFQLLTRSSEESISSTGLEILPLRTILIKPNNYQKFKVPHMGWNNIYKEHKESILLKNISLERRIFYYSNSYGILPSSSKNYIQSTYSHENEFIAILEHNNVCGIQFHPEKSRKQGLQLLNNFLQK